MRLPSLPLPKLGFRSVPAVWRWAGMGVVFLGLIAFTSKRRFAKEDQEIKVEIAQKDWLQFVDEEQTHQLVEHQVLAAIKEQGIGKPILLGKIEAMLERNPFIHKANISQALSGTITVEIEQSEPIARVLGLFGGDHYITKGGRVIPVSPLYTTRVLLLEGPGARRLLQALPAKDSAALCLFDLVSRIRQDAFWHAQAAQLYVHTDGSVRLFPQVGQQVFELGQPGNLEAKFKRMEAFYKHILPHKGWGRYRTVNVQYQNQIICQ
jgi:cell division protein FtsQ